MGQLDSLCLSHFRLTSRCKLCSGVQIQSWTPDKCKPVVITASTHDNSNGMGIELVLGDAIVESVSWCRWFRTASAAASLSVWKLPPMPDFHSTRRIYSSNFFPNRECVILRTSICDHNIRLDGTREHFQVKVTRNLFRNAMILKNVPTVSGLYHHIHGLHTFVQMINRPFDMIYPELSLVCLQKRNTVSSSLCVRTG